MKRPSENPARAKGSRRRPRSRDVESDAPERVRAGRPSATAGRVAASGAGPAHKVSPTRSQTTSSKPASTPQPGTTQHRVEVWSAYRDNLARHLIGIARDFQNRALHELTETRGYEGLRPSFGPLLSLVALEPRSLGHLAEQLAISPQATSQLVNTAERAGYLERRPDPQDGRARKIALTALGGRLVADAIRILHAVEADYRASVGLDDYASLVDALGRLFHGLALPTHRDASAADRSGATLGVLPLLSIRIQRDLMEATAARGHANLKMSHAQVLPLIGPEGARVHELARVQGVSRQAISMTARDLEAQGYLGRAADPRDRRGVVYRLSARGLRLIEDSVAALDELDGTLRELLGAKRFSALRTAARNLYRTLHLEEEIFQQDEHELEGLADRLRRRLGPSDSERLAALLDPRPGTRARKNGPTRETRRSSGKERTP